MNERIKQLAEQAEETLTWKEFNDDGHSEVTRTKQQVNIEKFAELIVRECMEQCTKVEEEYELYGALLCRDEIKEHFGVEE